MSKNSERTYSDPAGGSVLWELAAPVTLLSWRLLTVPLKDGWKDWIVLLSAYWIYDRFREGRSEWSVVTVTVMAFLLGIYLLGQLPHAAAVWGIGV